MQREQGIGTTRESAAEVDAAFHGAECIACCAVREFPITLVPEHALGDEPEVNEAGCAVAPTRNKVPRRGAAVAPQAGASAGGRRSARQRWLVGPDGSAVPRPCESPSPLASAEARRRFPTTRGRFRGTLTSVLRR